MRESWRNVRAGSSRPPADDNLFIPRFNKSTGKTYLPPKSMVTLKDIQQARALLRGIAVRTPLVACRLARDRQILVKPENLQPIGSFKLRGAYNKISSLSPEQRGRGVVAHSSGNHAQGVAYAARVLGVKATIVIPRTAPPVKLAATRALGAEIVLVGPASEDRIRKAEELERERGLVPVPPYNDEKIIAGQGTIGLEILEDLAEPAAVVVPIGGGGLISGIATAIKESNPRVRVVGVEPEFAADAQASLRAGKIQSISGEDALRTMADGLRTQSIGAINFEHVRKYVDAIITVTEDEIKQAMRHLLFSARILAEPSGAVTTAAAMYHAGEIGASGTTVAVVSGGNVEPRVFCDVLMATN
jgi:threonine dehydratase